MGGWVEKQRVVKTRSGGFTLLELLIAIVIIGVLTAIAVPVFLGQRDNAYAASLQSDVANAAKTIEGTYVEGSGYAATASYEVGEGNTVEYCLLESGQAFGVVGVSDNTDQKFYYSSADGGSVTGNACLGQDTNNGGTASGGGSSGGAGALSFSYPSSTFTTGSNNQVLSPTVSGGSDDKSYAITAGTLPTGVSFDEETGEFTGPAASAWNFTATQISGGGSHTCAVTTTGGVKCWGYNGNGRLGDGTTTQRLTPVDVSGLTSGVASISAGAAHTCAVTTTGGAKCWGLGGWGQLGDGTGTQRLTPVDVSGLTSGVASISAGAAHTCAVTTTGGAKCWGRNNQGQLGNGGITESSTPVDVSGLTSGVASISTGDNHTCAVTTTGGAKCWGLNGNGQLGDGGTTQSTTPVNVSGLTSGVASISTGVNGSHTCALTTTGGVKCWGANGNGQLGDGGTTQSTTPVDVSGLTSGVASISTGQYHTCAVTTTGGAKCWGLNGNGQLGDGGTTQSTTPVNVSGLTNGVASISTGNNHTCALTTTGGVKGWGFNGGGQLGNGGGTAYIVTDLVNVLNFGPQPGFPASLTVTVTDSSGAATATPTLSQS